MLSKEQLVTAVRYNSRRFSGGHIQIDKLPTAWRQSSPTDIAAFAAEFQRRQGLPEDGKIGPDTYDRLLSGNLSGDGSPSNVDVSNAIVVDGARFMLPDDAVSSGVTASNYLDDGETRFERVNRRRVVSHFVLHETCGNTASGCVNSLLKKHLGVQLILSPNGHLSCHGDLIRDRMVHANQLNDMSFGVEVVNPYSPLYVVDKGVWSRTIRREWWTWVPPDSKEMMDLARRKGFGEIPQSYVLPTEQQMKAVRVLVPWLCKLTGVPYVFPTAELGPGLRKIPGWNVKPRSVPGPGVVAHRDFASHADGRYLLESLIRDR